jgi:hypothetical protein
LGAQRIFEDPRRHSAETPENVISLHPNRDPKGASPRAQEKIAEALANDPWLPSRDRQLAVCTLHRMRCGLPVPPGDARKMTAAYRQRRGELAALLRVYS